jgi:hypothetical protein
MWSKARRLGPCVALPPHARCRVGTVHRRPLLRHVDIWMRSPCPAHHLTPVYIQIPPSCALHSAHCRCSSASRERMPALPLCRRTEPSPPSLCPCIASRCFHAMRGYKRRPPSCLFSMLLASCPPPASRHHRARLCFLPHHRCRVTSPLLSPRAQVQELRQTLDLLLDLKVQHLHPH